MTIAEKLEQRGEQRGRQAGFVEGQQFGHSEGRAEGEQQGRDSERRAVATSMLQKGLDLALIAEVTQLDPGELIKLQTRLADKSLI